VGAGAAAETLLWPFSAAAPIHSVGRCPSPPPQSTITVRLPLNLLLLAALAAPWSLAAQHAEPRVTVTLDRESLSASDLVRARLWIANPDSVPLSSVVLHPAAPPGTVEFGVVRGSDCVKAGGAVPLGAVGAYSVTRADVCVRTGAEVAEGAANLSFAFEYAWPAVGKVRGGRAVTVVEKKMGVGLLGNDTVAGVSLRLAALVIPGMLFFLAVRLLGLPLVAQLASAEIAALSVLFSVLLFGIAALVRPAATPQGISVWRFVALCALAVAAALLARLVHAGVRANRRKYLIDPDDSTAEALWKALKMRERGMWRRLSAWFRKPPTGYEDVTVVLANGERVKGASLGETTDGRLVVLARFAIPVKKTDAAYASLLALEKDRRYADLASQASSDDNLELTTRQQIERPAADPSQIQFVERKDVARILRTDKATEPPVGVVPA
jgi:hypothetical protein